MEKNKLKNDLKKFLEPSCIRMLFLGMSAGIPILLIFSSLSLWLREAGVSRSSVTYFSWAALGYSFKFIWAPLVDQLPLPYLKNKLGQRRSWMLMSQIFIIFAICWMGFVDPAAGGSSLTFMAFAVVLLGFSSATQDIVIDAYRIESADSSLQALLSATYIAGYRLGMIIAGAGALVLAEYFGSTKELYSYNAWKWTFFIMASAMFIGIITTLVSPEPEIVGKRKKEYTDIDYIKVLGLFLLTVGIFISTFNIAPEFYAQTESAIANLFGNKALAGFVFGTIKLAIGVGISVLFVKIIFSLKILNNDMIRDSYVSPIKDFFDRYNKSLAILLLAVIGLYRVSDIVLGVISNVFYQDLGFTKTQIAAVVKTFGLVMTLVGGFLGGILTIRLGVFKVLLAGAVLSAATNLLFMLLATAGDNLTLFYLVISADNLSAGLASAAFVAFLSKLTNISFTATQFAIFTSLMTLLPKIFGGYSGTIVDSFGYNNFFLLTALMGMPVIFIVWKAGKVFELDTK